MAVLAASAAVRMAWRVLAPPQRAVMPVVNAIFRAAEAASSKARTTLAEKRSCVDR